MSYMSIAIARTCLNGAWDFIPCAEAAPSETVPRAGWLPQAFQVPSTWAKSLQGVRAPGESTWQSRQVKDPAARALPDGWQSLSDGWGYPNAWTAARSGWLRRHLDLAVPAPGRRLWLRFDAVAPRARIFLNGVRVAASEHPTLPIEVDITSCVKKGRNELAVLCVDYDRDAKHRPRVPTGNSWLLDTVGIWQDAWLIERGEIQVESLAIEARVAAGELRVRWTLRNDGALPRRVQLKADVIRWTPAPWHQAQTPQAGEALLTLPLRSVTVGPHEAIKVEAVVAASGLGRWEPHDPLLHQLRTTLTSDDGGCELHAQRFGWREMTIAGPDLLLNGRPLHLFSEWGHKLGPWCMTEAYIRKWFAMLRAANLNHTRLHTHPHPPMLLELADECGILVTVEAGLHGSGGDQGCEDDRYWELADDHVRRLVARDRNHPSVIMWSVCNEFRWNGCGLDRALVELPRLGALFRSLDPTRLAYYEGDTSLWDERAQDLTSRHYGKVCSGVGWWDRSRPLHSGEMSLHHFMGPNSAITLRGDRGWASYMEVDAAAGEDLEMIVEDGRADGVCAFGPWNLSCITNLRPYDRDVTLTWPDPSAPGMKPTRAPAHSCEIAFWEDGPGYQPTASFASWRQCFRPLAVIDRSRNGQAFAGTCFRRTLHVVNDLPRVVEGELRASVIQSTGQVIVGASFRIRVEPGRRTCVVVELELPAHLSPASYRWQIELDSPAGNDRWQRELRIATQERWSGAGLALLGPGTLCRQLEELGIPCRSVATPAEALAAGLKVLLVEPRAVAEGSSVNRDLETFCQAGGRAVVLAQDVSVCPVLEPALKPVQTAWVRAPGHPLLAGLVEEDLRFWGEDPFSLLAGDSYVATRTLRKDEGSHLQSVVDSGESGMGGGDLEHCVLGEVRSGTGLVILCQLRVSEKLATIPAARRLLFNMLQRACSFAPPAVAKVRLAGPRQAAEAVAAAQSGATVIVRGLRCEDLPEWSVALGVTLRPIQGKPGALPIYQALHAEGSGLGAGVSLADLSGVESWCYSAWNTPKPVDAPVAPFALEPAERLQPLLVTATRSHLAELMVAGGKTETLRSPTVSALRAQPAAQPGIVSGRIACGAGQVILDLFTPPSLEPLRARLTRWPNRLWVNCGGSPADGAFAGDVVRAMTGTSPGYPPRVFVQAGEVEAGLRARFHEATRPSMDGLWSKPILQLAAWRQIPLEEGVVLAEGSGPVWVYYLLDAPSARKNLAQADLGVPNPELMTFLELRGHGTVEAVVDAKVLPPVQLDGGPSAIADIELEQGKNHVLLRWTPRAAGDRLAMRWRDIMGRSETSYSFPD